MDSLTLRVKLLKRQEQRAKKARGSSSSNIGIATYNGLDNASGARVSNYRSVIELDGGKAFTKYVSNAVPPSVLDFYSGSRLGQPGIAGGRNA